MDDDGVRTISSANGDSRELTVGPSDEQSKTLTDSVMRIS